MKIMKVICDGCGEDLTTSKGQIGYRLMLDVDCLLSEDGRLIAAPDKPPLDRAHHFCNLRCLDRWRQESPTPSRLEP